MSLPVNEVFQTIQGEATHAGRPSVFVRLQGCAVGCMWCDTKHTWHVDATNKVATDAMLSKTAAYPTWAEVGEEELAGIVNTYTASHVVITGGEPCVYDLSDLTERLRKAGRSVQIETSGTQPVHVDGSTWVTLSPKIGMPGGYTVRSDALARADELKMPIGRMADVETLEQFLADRSVRPSLPIWLQPISMSPKATALCKVAAMAHNWRISLQLHAYAGWR